jgi:hypothetical protein
MISCCEWERALSVKKDIIRFNIDDGLSNILAHKWRVARHARIP